MAAAAEEEQVALGLQRRGRHVVERAASKGRGAWCSNSGEQYIERPAATRRGESVRNCCALNSLSSCAAERSARSRERVVAVARGPQRHGTEGPTCSSTGTCLVTPRGNCLPRWHPACCPAALHRKNCVVGIPTCYPHRKKTKIERNQQQP